MSEAASFLTPSGVTAPMQPLCRRTPCLVHAKKKQLRLGPLHRQQRTEIRNPGPVDSQLRLQMLPCAHAGTGSLPVPACGACSCSIECEGGGQLCGPLHANSPDLPYMSGVASIVKLGSAPSLCALIWAVLSCCGLEIEKYACLQCHTCCCAGFLTVHVFPFIHLRSREQVSA